MARTYPCPCCGVRLRILWSDPRASEYEVSCDTHLREVEFFDGRYAADEHRKWATACPSCGGLSLACGEWVSISQILGLAPGELDYAYEVAD